MDSVNVRVFIVAAVATAICGCKSESPLSPLERAARIEAASAVDFAGVVGTAVTPAPVVRVTDKDGDPVSDVLVSFTASAGSVNALPARTDAEGRASVTWILGTASSTQTLTATVGTLAPVVFSVKAAAGPPSSVEKASGDPPPLAAGTVIASPLRARVFDSFHNPVAGASVSFSVISGDGSVSPANAVTDSTGSVSANWTLGPVTGVQSVRAAIGSTFVLFTADSFTCPGATPPAPCTALDELIFLRTTDNQIYRMTVDGKGLKALTIVGNNGPPAWSPDGKRIAFTRYLSSTATSEVFVIDADGSNEVRLTTGGAYYGVAWSPDSHSLAVDGASGGDSLNIYILSADAPGPPPAVLITNGGSPSWSPDGKRIAYTHGTGYYDASQIYVRNVDGTDAHRATPDSVGWNWYPEWSPDGKKIAFTRCTQTCGIYAIDVSSSTVTLLVGAGSGNQDPAWSADGKWLAMTVYGSTAPSINYAPATGGAPRTILSNAYAPSWRPRSP